MPGKKDDPNYPVTNTPDASTGVGDQNVPVTGVDGQTTPLTAAPGKQLFGDGPQPPTLPANAAGVSGDPVSKTLASQASADQAMSGSAGGPGLPTNNAFAAAQANADNTLHGFDLDNPESDVTPVRIPGTLARGRMAQANAPHYFSEQVDNVFIPDFLIYICGANVTPHVKGTLQWSYGLDSTPNTCSFTLDNSNDKFTITPENIIYNHFHAGVTSNPVGEFDDSAKAKIWLYKNNELPLPHGPGNFRPNTLPEDDAGGRRLPLNLFGSIFHKMDPIRVWIRVGAYDEWLPAFAGYVMRHTHTDGWVDMNREVQIQASCIRDVMRRQRVQHNSIRYQMPGTQTTTDAYEPQTTGHDFDTPNAENLGSKTKIDNNSFFQSIMRGGNKFAFAWSGMSFKQLSEYMTIGGMAPSEKNVEAAKDTARNVKIQSLTDQIKTTEAAIATERNNLLLDDAKDFSAYYTDELKGVVIQLDALDAAIATNPEQRATADQAAQQQFLRGRRDNLDATIRQGYRDKSNAEIAAQQRKLTDLQQQLADITKNFHTSTQGSEPVQGIGRMTVGERVYYPATTDISASGQKQNSDTLDRWYRICSFGSPVRSKKPDLAAGSARHVVTGMDEKPDMSSQNVRYWTLDEIANPKYGAGVRCRWDDLWAPDNQLVHWLLPSPNGNGKSVGLSGANTTEITDNTLNLNVVGVRAWYTRDQMIQEFATMVDYRWWVTGVGDIVFEFPFYDFDPQDLGPWQDVLTVDYHALSSTLDEEAGDAPTGVRAVGTITGNMNLNTENISEATPAPNDLVYSPNLTSRLGISIKTINYPFIKDKVMLTKLAIAAFQKAALESEQSGLEIGWRPWILPNKPIKFVPRDRISLTGTVNHSMTVFGSCATSMETGFTRQIDTTGLRRYMTGGAHQPISFGLIGGASNLAASTAARVALERKNINAFIDNRNAASRKAQLDANVVHDTSNSTDKFPDGYDRYNVANFGSFDSTGKPDAGQQAQQAAMDAKSAAFSDKQDASAAGLTGSAHVLPGGTITGTSGVWSASNPPPVVAQNAPSQQSISIGTGPSVDGLSGISSDAAKQLQGSLGKAGKFSSVDIFNLGAIIASQTRGKDASSAVKTAVGWTVLNGAGANSDLNKLKPNAISGAAAASHPQWVDAESTDIARSILAGDIADTTGGATGFANYDPNVPYADPRICNALTGKMVAVTPGATMTGTGQPVADIGKFVFFKRSATNEAQVSAAAQAKNVNLPAPFDQIQDFTKAAAAKFGIQEAVLCGYIKHECGGHYNSDRLVPNDTGDIGAGTNWVLFESALFDFASSSLTGNNELIREHNHHIQDSMVVSTGAVWSLYHLWHRKNEGTYDSVFVRTRVVDASQTVFKGAVVGGVSLATFWHGKAAEVLAAAGGNGSMDNVLKPYTKAEMAADPLTAIVASPRVNVFLSAKAIRLWLNKYANNSITTYANGKYTDMDLGQFSIDAYYKAAYSMGNSGQVDTLLYLGSSMQPVDFKGVPVSTTSKNISFPGGTAVPVVGGVAMHGNAIGGQPLGEFILDEANKTFWPPIKARNAPSLIDKCQTGDPQAISELEKRFQNSQTLDQTLASLYSKQGG